MAEPVIIGCFPRSGSTLLRCILNTHPNIYAGPELGFRIKAILEQLYGMGKKANLIEQDTKKLARLWIENFYQTACYRNNKTRWIDKSPLNLTFSSYWKDVFPNSKFIIMVRDPRDCLASFRKLGYSKVLNAFWPGAGFDDDEYKMFLFILQLFEELKKEIESTLEIYGQDCLIIKYEDLIANTKRTLKNLIEFIGEDWSDNLTHHQDFSNIVDYESGKVFGWIDKDSVQSIHNTNIDQWKNIVREEELELISNPVQLTMGTLEINLDFPAIVEGLGYSNA